MSLSPEEQAELSRLERDFADGAYRLHGDTIREVADRIKVLRAQAVSDESGRKADMTTPDNHDTAMTRQDAEAIWWDEAKTKITTQDVGSSVVVLVEGHKVAEFLTWAALVTKTDAGSAAEDYASRLREAYLALAKGDKR